MTKSGAAGIAICLGLLVASALAAPGVSADDWLAKVPAKEHALKNPYAKDATMAGTGAAVFHGHCALCHGQHAEGTKRAPKLISDRVQGRATAGDLHWVLANGIKGHGMPAWSSLGDKQLWELVSYLKSLR